MAEIKCPGRVFVSSMTDLFHERVPFEWLDRVLAVMALASQHTFCLLTKRPARMREYLTQRNSSAWADRLTDAAGNLFSSEAWAKAGNAINGQLSEGHNVGWPMRNVWLGVTVEDQKRADERIPILLDTPAARRFVSCEPLLGAVDVRPWLHGGDCRTIPGLECLEYELDDVQGSICPKVCPGRKMVYADGAYDYSKPETCVTLPVNLDWVIAGGETGPGSRPMHPDWVRSLRDQATAAGVPFFMKKMSGGGQPPEDLMVREFPNANP